MPTLAPVETKPWYKSATLYGIAIAAVALLLGWIGQPEVAANLQVEQVSIMEIVDKVAVIVGLAVAAWGRLTAKTVITK